MFSSLHLGVWPVVLVANDRNLRYISWGMGVGPIYVR